MGYINLMVLAERQLFCFSGFLDELFPALGAGNGDFAFPPGHAHRLAAAGTVEVTVIPILDLIQHHQEFPVFLITQIGLSGKRTENGPEHTAVGQEGKAQIHQRRLDKHGHQADHNTGAQNRHIQLVRAVAAHHEAAHAVADLLTQGAQPISNSVHVITLLINI